MNLIAKAKKEFKILEQQPDYQDLLIYPFKDQILSLVEAFGNSGQSGGSAPYYIGAITNAISKLLNHQPLSPLTGEDSEWDDVSRYSDNRVLGPTDIMWQNIRDFRIFKRQNGETFTIEAVVWCDKVNDCAFTGNVEGYSGSKLINFPYTPTDAIYVDVERIPTEDPDDWQYKIAEHHKDLVASLDLEKA